MKGSVLLAVLNALGFSGGVFFLLARLALRPWLFLWRNLVAQLCLVSL
jgi:hypothetical protein